VIALTSYCQRICALHCCLSIVSNNIICTSISASQQTTNNNMPTAGEIILYASTAAGVLSLLYQGIRFKLNNDVLAYERSLPCNRPMTPAERAELLRRCRRADRFSGMGLAVEFEEEEDE
jgi:hypothetical protein